MDKRIEAIRNDVMVGRGSCSSIDECYSDDELLKALDDSGHGSLASPIESPHAAVEWARRCETMWLEQGLNQRWGADDDPQLLMYNEWMSNLDKNPIRC
jgi:hypothetical protein